MANFDLKDRSAIVGVGESAYGRKLMRSPIDLAADAIANALDDAGLARERPRRSHREFRLAHWRRRRHARAGARPEPSRLQPDLGARPLHRKLHPVGRDDGQCGPRRCGRVSRVGEFLRHASGPNDGRRRRSRGRSRSRRWPRRGSGFRHDLARRGRRDGRAPLLRALRRRQPRARRRCRSRFASTPR